MKLKDTKSRMMLKVLVNRYNPKAGNALLKFLPQEEAQAVSSQEILSKDITPILYQPQRLIGRMHYSWLQPLIEKFSLELRPIALAALKPEQTSSIRSPNTPSIFISEPVKNFFINEIYKMLEAEEHLPFEYLPETELSPLASWSKKKLVDLIDFLGLHDLASEIRHIVNKTHLQNLYSCLSPSQRAYLKICLYHKEKLKSRRLEINLAKQNCDKLKRILHQRGLSRFSYALAGQHPDFIWYIAHTLDIGRGKILLKHANNKVTANVTSILKSQVINLMNFIKQE